MSATTLNSITNGVILYTPCVLLLFGNVSCVLNLVTFTAKELRRNSCGWYFLMSAIVDLFYINFGLISKFSTDNLGSNFHNTSRIYCKFRIFLTWALPSMSTSYLVLAALDRYLSTSEKTHFRLFSTIRLARRIAIVPIILYLLTSSHQLFYYDLRPKCAAQPGGYSIFISVYSIVWTSLIPQILLFLFGFKTYRNIHSSRKRILRVNEKQRSRTDVHLIKMTFIQVIVSSILLNIRTIYYSYSILSTDISKSDRQIALESLLLQISSFIFYANFCKSFYFNTLMSKLFRQVLVKRLLLCFNPITPRKFRIHPTTTDNHQAIQFNRTMTRRIY